MRRMAANVPQTYIKIVVVILQNPFPNVMSFVCVFTQLQMLQVMEKPNTVMGSKPRNSCLNKVSSPPVVGVPVFDNKSISTWTVTWVNTSIPKKRIFIFCIYICLKVLCFVPNSMVNQLTNCFLIFLLLTKRFKASISKFWANFLAFSKVTR